MTLDLDALTAVVAAMTPGPWTPVTYLSPVQGLRWNSALGPDGRNVIELESSLREPTADHGNIRGVCALRNGAADLIRLARVGAAYIAWENSPSDRDLSLALNRAVRAATKEPS